MNKYIRLLPTTHQHFIGYDANGKPMWEFTAPGLIDIRAYPHLAPFTVPAPEQDSQ